MTALRPLGGGRVVQVGEGLAVHGCGQAWEVRTQGLRRQRGLDCGKAGGGAVHDVQAASRCGANSRSARLSIPSAIPCARGSSMSLLIEEANARTSMARA